MSDAKVWMDEIEGAEVGAGRGGAGKVGEEDVN